MATRKVKDDKGREYEIEVDDDDDDDDGPFIDEADLKGLFDKWLGERESSQNQQQQTPPKKRGAIRIKASQQTPPKSEPQRPRRLRLA